MMKFRPSLFIKYYTVAAVILAVFTMAMYALSVPFVQDAVFEMEKRSSVTILDNIYEHVETIGKDMAAYEESVLSIRKTELKDVLSIVENYINEVEKDIRSGKLTRQEALKRITSRVKAFKYGHNDYVFIADYNSVLVSHPDPKLFGRDFSSVRDVDGRLVVPPMVEIARRDGEGFYTYRWIRLGANASNDAGGGLAAASSSRAPVEKITFVRDLPKWKWVIGTGVYLDDVKKEVERKKTLAIEKLRSTIKNIKIANTGYVYIFQPNGKMLIHPNKDVELTDYNFRNRVNPVFKKPLYLELIDAADRKEGLRYKWDRPDDSGNYGYDKISWIRHSDAFDWYIGASVYVDELYKSAHTIRNRILGASILIFIISAAAACILVRRLTEPLKRLSAAAMRVKEKDFPPRVEVAGSDDIAVFAEVFNDMVEQLRQYVHTLDTKVNERTMELKKAYDELKQLDDMKTAFLSNVSHELRTPLTSVLGFTEVVREKLENVIFPHVVTDNAKVLKAMARVTDNIDIVISEAGRLTALINDVLDLTKMESGSMDWEGQPVSIRDVIDRSVNATRALFDAKKDLKLTTDIAEGIPPVTGDPNRLIQVMINLISNAVNFTPSGTITCRATADGEGVTVSVSDTGVGIQKEHLEKVFEKFRQIGGILTDKPRGTGLGLPICRDIINRHGGRIRVESVPGVGSVFSFVIPFGGFENRAGG
jgi:signal transduction histidine kinase